MGAVIKATARPTGVCCPYCSAPAELVHGSALFLANRAFANRPYWACTPCRAWVGCHKGSTRPLGTLAKARLRMLRSQAHAAFDLIWQPKGGDAMELKRRRSRAYRWLAQQLRISTDDCHIGQMTEDQCRRVIEVSQKRLIEAKGVGHGQRRAQGIGSAGRDHGSPDGAGLQPLTLEDLGQGDLEPAG